jgi:hypothetical protein
MARTRGSLVRTNLEIFAREKVGCLNWGLVSGKTNTIYQWISDGGLASPLGDNVPEPKVWFHDLFCKDGTPYDQGEINLFKKLTAR